MSRGWKVALSIQALAVAGLALVAITGSMAAFQIWAGALLGVLGFVVIVYRSSLAEWLDYDRWGPWWWGLFRPSLDARMTYLRVTLIMLGVLAVLAGSGLLAVGSATLLRL
ncbi:MAG: hypothetical protein ACYC6T_05905 [Thermoleophilia bacterium]